MDGNKRVAFMTTTAFLRKNAVFCAGSGHATAIIISLAVGEISEQNLARWIRDN